MLELNKELVELITVNKQGKNLLSGNFGIEKENVRVNYDGKLAITPHPKVFGDKSENPYITTDFSESQVEMITPTVDSLEEVYRYLETLQNIVSLSLENELLWPQSLPPILPAEKDIPLANYNTDEILVKDNANLYREYLADKYGRKKQMISGIHYNFSFKDGILKKLYENTASDVTFREFKDRLYMKMVRNITKYSWFIIRLLGSSPAIHESYIDYCKRCSKQSKSDKSPCNFTASIRNGKCGYNNIDNYYVTLDTLDDYIKGIRKLIESGHLISSKEYYSVIRPKSNNGNLSGLEEHGIDYLELRLMDINPLFKLGFSIDDLYLIHLFMIFSAMLDDDYMDETLFNDSIKNNQKVADKGRMENLKIVFDGQDTSVEALSLEVINTLRQIVTVIDTKKDFLNGIIDKYEEMILEHEKLYSSILFKEIKQQGFIKFHLDKAIKYLENSKAQEFNFIGFEDMELSTQILMLNSIKRGVKVEILDRNENFIELSYKDKKEYVKQATKTSKDTYSTVLIMENKLVTKKILEKSGIKVPGGDVYTNIENALDDYYKYKNMNIVIKPNSTNFGIGITIFKNIFTEQDYETALKLAFEKDDTVLVEEFIEGKEYRVFVIDNEVVGVLRRVPANVIGDGSSTIRELVATKNTDPLRGKGYRKPLEKIKLGTPEKMFLAQQELDFDSILEKDRIVYLRENSNISTGGDSIDYTDDISDSLKEIAIEAAKAVGASIVGVDLITKDIEGDALNNYGIIELNFNPAIHIHCYPYIGDNRKLGEKILDLLGFHTYDN
ncbi:bifunctional glutamate--cysteine ligase GshA/glutathione synthetase GshB [Vallitalea guaymasensis]|uniref:bifunctional glutamate--cysteine ligase GshA/glutathione synthetase GshB n=1 Tax=Vallitalea guaymasensis TaxID=1185412 RepID=UPI000DE4CF7C|nr:bifunctional glutamate--cysteine ligase GshA/glutathione synthetase GshB [Vallitalea guaymasensis]